MKKISKHLSLSIELEKTFHKSVGVPTIENWDVFNIYETKQALFLSHIGQRSQHMHQLVSCPRYLSISAQIMWANSMVGRVRYSARSHQIFNGQHYIFGSDEKQNLEKHSGWHLSPSLFPLQNAISQHHKTNKFQLILPPLCPHPNRVLHFWRLAF